MINISIFVDDQQTGEFEGKKNTEISIGRSPGCMVRLADSSVSRLHAIIRYTEENLWLIEKRATNNTVLLNGEEIENAVLEGGEEILISNFTLRINITEDEASQKINTEALGLSDDLRASNEEDGKTKISKTPLKAYLLFPTNTANTERFSVEKKSTLIGRGTGCDIILFEKQCSRKHLELSKVGLTFHLKDLNTVNGTYVNGEKVKTHELEPGDIIKVGELEFKFDIENINAGALEYQDNEFQTPQFPIPIDDIEPLVPMEAQKEEGELSETEENLDEAIKNEKNLIKKRWMQFKKLPKTKRYIILLLILALIPLVFPEPEKKSGSQTANPRSYVNLSPKKQAAVKKSYEKIIIAKEKGQYTVMLDNATKILKLVDKFRDTKFYQKEAKQALHKQRVQEEKEREARAERKIQEKILELENEGRAIFEKALNDPAKRVDLELIAQKIYAVDPSNINAQTWQSRIAAKIEQEREEKSEKIRKEKIAKRAEKELLKIESMVEAKKYTKAIEAADTVLQSSPYKDQDYRKRVVDTKKEAMVLLSAAIDPLIKVAERNREAGGDLVKSKESYMAILDMAPQNTVAKQGLKDIRSILHIRAKKLYTQAILAESVTFLSEALQKFKECIKVAPDDDIYKKRCRAKIVKYEAFGEEQ